MNEHLNENLHAYTIEQAKQRASRDHVREPLLVSRRRLLQMLGISSVAAVPGVLGACTSSSEAANQGKSAKSNAAKSKSTQAVKTSASKPASKNDSRVLILLELGGGHDGFAMHVPYGDGAFRKLRDRLWIDPKELHVIDDRYAISKGLAPVADRLTFVEGVGVAKPNLSHFEMLQRWWSGDADMNASYSTGFLGRCCDALMKNEPVTAVSLGGGSTPTLITNKATTVALPALDATRELVKDEPENRRLREAVGAMSRPSKNAAGIGSNEMTDQWLNMARNGLNASLDLTKMVGRLGELPGSYPKDNDIARSLGMARQLVSLNAGIRIIHIPWGSFDTHSNQNGTHVDHMNRLGAGLQAFTKDLQENGLNDRVLLATTSEFGRRAEANQSGTDHGTASTMMMIGPKPGRHGSAPNFKQLDPEGNVKATVSMTDYYASLARWLGINPGDVLAKGANPIDSLGI